MNALTAAEHVILDFIQQTFRSPFFDRFWVVITHLGDDGIIWIVLTVILLIYPKTRKIGVICAVSLLCSLLLTNIVLKNLIARARPFTLVDIEPLVIPSGEFSFPSGHTSASFAAALVLWKERARIGRLEIYRLGMALACLISFSRLYVYVHYPTDVLAGIVAGYVCCLIARRLGLVLHERIGFLMGNRD